MLGSGGSIPALGLAAPIGRRAAQREGGSPHFGGSTKALGSARGHGGDAATLCPVQRSRRRLSPHHPLPLSHPQPSPLPRPAPGGLGAEPHSAASAQTSLLLPPPGAPHPTGALCPIPPGPHAPSHRRCALGLCSIPEVRVQGRAKEAERPTLGGCRCLPPSSQTHLISLINAAVTGTIKQSQEPWCGFSLPGLRWKDGEGVIHSTRETLAFRRLAFPSSSQLQASAFALVLCGAEAHSAEGHGPCIFTAVPSPSLIHQSRGPYRRLTCPAARGEQVCALRRPRLPPTARSLGKLWPPCGPTGWSPQIGRGLKNSSVPSP